MANQSTWRHAVKTYSIGFAVIVALAALNHWLFNIYYQTTHWRWYLEHGAWIGFVTSIVAMAWGDANRNSDLISSHPLRYLAACCWMVALPLFAIGTHLRKDDSGRTRNPFDLLVTVSFALIILVLLLGWAIVVVPLQYVVYLVCGAPARVFLESSWRPVAQQQNGRIAVEEVAMNSKIPEGWWDASLFSKPVSSTSLMSSLFFLLVKTFG